MTWGRGFGVPYGGGPVIAVDQPLSEIAGEPTTFVFTDEPDGRLPGLWGFFALEHDGAGGVVWSEEPTPNAFFRVAGGFGLWDYTRAPSLPGPTDPFSERGYVATPLNVLEGRNARASVILRQPEVLLDDSADEFVWRAAIALRLDSQGPAWVGARMRAEWAAGVWTSELVLEIIVEDGTGETVVATASLPEFPDLVDVWRTQDQAELEVELRDTTLKATVSGVISVEAQVPGVNRAQVALLFEVFNRFGATLVAPPSVIAAQFQSLRDFSALGPPPQLPGALHLEAPEFAEMFPLPVLDLFAKKLIKRLRGRQIQFLQDTSVEIPGSGTFVFNQGEVVRLREKLSSQEFVPSTRDLHYERTRKDS